MPLDWADAHHKTPWYLGGRADIDNLVLIGRYHHVKVHEGHWTITWNKPAGTVEVTRPDGTPYEF